MAKKEAKKSKSKVVRPKQQRLPGTEDAKIDALEDAAEEYARIRDERVALSAEEVELKGKLLDLMKANKKENYVRDGIEIHIVHEEETVKVKIKKQDSDE